MKMSIVFPRFAYLSTALGLALLLGLPQGSSAQIVLLGGRVRVVNATAEVLTVAVDGLAVGQVQPGQFARFLNIPAGWKSILVTNMLGQVRSTGRFFLGAGARYIWTVSPPPMIIVPRVIVVEPRGTVQITNRFPAAVNIIINTKFRGTIFPGQTAVYYNLRPGTKLLTALNPALPTQEYFRQMISVVGGATQYVSVVPQVGVVRVANSRPEAIELLVDGTVPVFVQPGQTIDMPNVAIGDRNLVARVAGQVVQTAVATIFPGQLYTWYIRAAVGAVRAINRGLEPVTLMVNGASNGPLVPGQERFLTNIPMGVYKLAAVAPDGNVRSALDLALGAGETRMWLIEGLAVHEPHTHMHAHPHAVSPHHHHEHIHPHPPGFDHHHRY